MEKDIIIVKEFCVLPGDELHIFVKNISEPVKLYLGKCDIKREVIKEFLIDLSHDS